MKRGKEFRSRFYSLNPQLNYLPEGDRYLFALDRPKYRINVIGVGSNGQEHMSIAFLEGLATVHGIFDPNPRSIEIAKRVHAKFAPGRNLVVYDSLEKACRDPEADQHSHRQGRLLVNCRRGRGQGVGQNGRRREYTLTLEKKRD